MSYTWISVRSYIKGKCLHKVFLEMSDAEYTQHWIYSGPLNGIKNIIPLCPLVELIDIEGSRRLLQ